MLHKFDPSIPDLCWRCYWAVGPAIEQLAPCCIFGGNAQYSNSFGMQYITQLCGWWHTLLRLPWHSYFFTTRCFAEGDTLKSLAMQMVKATKMWIYIHWGMTQVSSLERFRRISKIAEMKELISMAHNPPSKFTSVWACWLHFLTTADFLHVSGAS